MKHILMVTLALFLTSSAIAQDQYLLEDFEKFTVGKMNLSGWYIRDVIGSPHDIYSIKSAEGNKFLYADNNGEYVQLFKRKRWKIDSYPILQWKWKVIQHAKDSNPMSSPNDSAAGVYVAFKKGWFSVRTIKYIWAESGEIGHVRRTNDDYPQIIIRTGDKKVGQWVTEQRNVYEDYKQLFDEKPRNPIAFGVVTDADEIKVKKATAAYDDFYAVEEMKKEKKEKNKKE